MSLRIASVLAWILGVLALLTGLGGLRGFGSMNLAGRTTTVWLLCAGVALIAVGIGLPRRRRYAPWTAIIVCGLWLTTQIVAVVRLFRSGESWSAITWVIIATQSLFCLAIVGTVLRNSTRDESLDNRGSAADAA